MATFALRLDGNGGRIDGAGIFTAAAADAFFLLHAGPVLCVGINGVLRTLFLADQTEFSVRPTQALGMVDDRPAHQNLGNGDLFDGSGRTDLLALPTKFTARLPGNDVRSQKQAGTAGDRHGQDTLTGADFDATPAAAATTEKVVFLAGTGRA